VAINMITPILVDQKWIIKKTQFKSVSSKCFKTVR